MTLHLRSARAFTIAQSGRPGPVLVDVTKDVTAAVTEYDLSGADTDRCRILPRCWNLTWIRQQN